MKLKVLPWLSVWLPKAPLSLVTVCGAPSLFVHVTFVPAFTVRFAGLKAKPEMLAETGEGVGAGVGVGVGAGAGVGVGVGAGVGD